VPDKRTSPAERVRGQLRNAGLRARKGLGQHFLIDKSVRDIIIDAAELSSSDIVLEVGPGLGVLTEELVKKASRVIAVELDHNLALRLGRKLTSQHNFELINSDILELDLRKVLGKTAEYKVVANIPYYITSPILHYFMRSKLKPVLMVVMVQEEVARAIAAKPGDMSFLSVSLQVYSRPEVVCRVPANSFYPPPKVESAVVRFRILDEPAVTVDDMQCFLKIVQAGFAAPRKQLRNSLALGLNIEPVNAVKILEKAGLNPKRRAETLTLGEWQDLYSCVIAVKGGASNQC